MVTAILQKVWIALVIPLPASSTFQLHLPFKLFTNKRLFMKQNLLNLQRIGASLILIAAVFTLHSCSRALDEKVYSQVPVDQFYQTVDQAQLALNGVYSNSLWNDP